MEIEWEWQKDIRKKARCNQERWEGRDYGDSDKHILKSQMNESAND